MNSLIEEIEAGSYGEFRKNESMKNHSTMAIGGIAKVMIIPKDIDSLVEIIQRTKIEKLDYFVIGKGSNTIFPDGEINTLIIKISNTLDDFCQEGNVIKVGAGFPVAKLAKQMSKNGFIGLEFAAGIPATVGGAVYMNAGAHLSEMSNVVKNVRTIENGKLKNYNLEECQFGYRKSIFQNNNNIIVEVEFELKPGNGISEFKKMAGNLEYRKEKQPLDLPSCGSVFRNPDNNHAGKLIEECGMKGLIIGGAQVSEKHANFIVNIDGAKASDVKVLIDKIKEEVKKQKGIKLVAEIDFAEIK
jgi:UDP-N-acetylmuramate dehydrogenase